MTPPLTILVPTYNRSQLLARLLRYYEACGAPYPMRILDSSDEPATLPALSAPAGRVTQVRYDAHTLPTTKLFDGLSQVTTPYVVVWADDDLMVPSSIAACAAFLDGHPEASVAHGYSELFQVGEAGGHPVISNRWSYRQRSYLGETASQRLRRYLQDYTTLFYSVHRTAHLAANLERCRVYGWSAAPVVPAVHRSDWWVELVLGCLSAIQGEAHRLDYLYMQRDRHAGVDSWESPAGRREPLDWFDWVTSSSFSTAYGAFRLCLGEALVQQDRISTDEASTVVKEAFWSYLAKLLAGKRQARYGRPGWSARHRLSQGVRGITDQYRRWTYRAQLRLIDRAIQEAPWNGAAARDAGRAGAELLPR